VSLSPSLTELVAVLNSTQLLVGRTSVDTRPNFISHVTIVANPTPDVEKIIKLQPDLVLVEENLINAQQLEKLKQQKGFHVEVFDIDSIEDWRNTVARLGSLLQAHARASEVIDRVHQAQARSVLPASMYKPKVLVAMSASPPWVAGTKSYQADVIRAAGGEPVGPDADRFVPVTPEMVVKWNPDIVATSSDSANYSGPGWSSTRAFRDGDVLQINEDLLLRTGGDLEKLIDALSKEIRRVGSTR
jgi:iron complex transport system substrate-binding protein